MHRRIFWQLLLLTEFFASFYGLFGANMHDLNQNNSALESELTIAIKENDLPAIKSLIKGKADAITESLFETALELRHFQIICFFLEIAPRLKEYTSDKHSQLLHLVTLSDYPAKDSAHLTVVMENFSKWLLSKPQHTSTFLREDTPALRGLTQFLMTAQIFSGIKKFLQHENLVLDGCNVQAIKKNTGPCKTSIIFLLSCIKNLLSNLPNGNLGTNKQFFNNFKIMLHKNFNNEDLTKEHLLCFLFLRFINPILIRPNPLLSKKIDYGMQSRVFAARCIQKLLSKDDPSGTELAPLRNFFQRRNKRGKQATKLLDEIYTVLF